MTIKQQGIAWLFLAWVVMWVSAFGVTLITPSIFNVWFGFPLMMTIIIGVVYPLVRGVTTLVNGKHYVYYNSDKGT